MFFLPLYVYSLRNKVYVYKIFIKFILNISLTFVLYINNNLKFMNLKYLDKKKMSTCTSTTEKCNNTITHISSYSQNFNLKNNATV